MLGKVGCFVYLKVLLVGCLGGLVLEFDIYGAVNKKCNFSFWIESGAWRVSFCFRSLDIADIFWNYIKSILGYFFLGILLLKIDTLLTPCETCLFVFHAHSLFHCHA